MVSSFPCLRLIQQDPIPVQNSHSSPPSLHTFCTKLSVLSHVLCVLEFSPELQRALCCSKTGRKWSFIPRIVLASRSWSLTPLLHVLGQHWAFMFLLGEQKAVRHPLTVYHLTETCFFPDTTHHIHSLLSHGNIPGKTVLAIHISCMITGISVRHLIPSSFMNFLGISLEYGVCVSASLFRLTALSFSDLADNTLLMALFSFTFFYLLLPSLPAKVVDHNVTFLFLIYHTRNFRHNPKLAWCNVFCNENLTLS